jgi:PRTRC genetic system protein A
MLDYLTNPVDKACFSVTPTLMAPRFGTLPEIEVGQQRFIIAKGGVYIEARTPTLHARLRVSEPDQPFPYGDVDEHIRLTGGHIPFEVIDNARQMAVSNSPNEWGGSICWSPERGYWLEQPEILTQTGEMLSYRNTVDDSQLVLDIHSHGLHGAYFSGTDDADDIDRGGVYLAAVIGSCDSETATDVSTMRVALRMVINGHLIDLTRGVPWETVGDNINEPCGEDAAC